MAKTRVQFHNAAPSIIDLIDIANATGPREVVFNDGVELKAVSSGVYEITYNYVKRGSLPLAGVALVTSA